MDDAAPIPPLRFRTVFISDVHLGTRGCQAELLLDFIRHIDCETLYLVGDIIDGWRLKSGWYWPQAHNDVVQKVLRMARKGVRVVYIPGNHDEFARDYGGLHFGGAELVLEAIHETANGKRLLVIHGDHFDGVVRYAKWLALLGDWGESCTALVEHFDGQLEIIQWAKQRSWSMLDRRASAQAPAGEAAIA